MKFTLSWLKDHLETTASAAEIAEALTDLGLEVEEVLDPAARLRPFTIARVIEAAPHPNADRLRVCRVDAGGGETQVVCGAPNARTGMIGVFAPPGTHIPGTGLDLAPGVIRGVESNGMLCSERELELSEDHDGVIELPDDAPVGARYVDWAGLNDPVFDVNVTPNRQDCFGVYGIARDLAARGLGTLASGEVEPVPGAFESRQRVGLRFPDAAADACSMFVGRMITGARNGPSPDWMRRRLTAVGLRPISALVDITNYVSLDRCRPLHVYDGQKLRGEIHARLGRKGERFLALNDKTYDVDETMTVIADDSGVLGLGGVIGGASSGCDHDTTEVFIESALFDPLRTAQTGRKLDLVTDARQRFERGVDPTFVVAGAELATRLILDICGGSPSELVIAGQAPEWRRRVVLRPTRVRALAGIEAGAEECARVLGRLGFDAAPEGDALSVAPPPWRSDIDGEADLVEEVARVLGYAGVPSTPMRRLSAVATPAVSASQRRARIARRALAARGMVECVTYSFVKRDAARLFGGGDDRLEVVNPISSEMSSMRPTAIIGLIEAAARNVDRGIDDLALFEVGPAYAGVHPQDQRISAFGLRRGATGPRHWSGEGGAVDVFAAKADALALLEELGAPVDSLQVAADAAPDWMHPGQSAALKLGPKTTLAIFGAVHPRVLKAMDLKGPAVAFEVMLDALPPPKARATRAKPPLDVSDLQAVERDFAFIVDADTPADAILRAARSADRKLIEAASVFDVYDGHGVEPGKKSVAICVRLQPQERTLTDADIEAAAKKIVAKVEKAVGGALRG